MTTEEQRNGGTILNYPRALRKKRLTKQIAGHRDAAVAAEMQ